MTQFFDPFYPPVPKPWSNEVPVRAVEAEAEREPKAVEPVEASAEIVRGADLRSQK